MHPYFWTQVQPFQAFNPTDMGMAQRPLPWFDPNAYQTTYNPLTYRSAYPGFEANPYYTGILPRAVFQMPNPFISPEIGRGVPPVSFAREQFLTRGTGRELGELSEKARICFRALAPDSE